MNTAYTSIKNMTNFRNFSFDSTTSKIKFGNLCYFIFHLIIQNMFKYVDLGNLMAFNGIQLMAKSLRKETEILVETNFRSFIFYFTIQKGCFWLYSLP